MIMEFASRMRWILLVIVFLIIVVLIGWGISSVSRNIFSRSGTNVTTPTQIADFSGIDVARFMVEGPIVAAEEQRSYTIEVSENVVVMRILSNYGRSVVAERSYQNNTIAYNEFIAALEKERVDARVQGTTTEDDQKEDGACPTGKRYILELNDELRRWSTTCERVRGTAGVPLSTIRKLFNAQVPDYNELVKGTVLAKN